MFSTCAVIEGHTLRVCFSVYGSITCTRSPPARRSQNFRCSEFGEISSHCHQHTLAHITLTMLYSDRDAIVAGLPLHSAGLPLYICHFCDGHCLAFGSSDGRNKEEAAHRRRRWKSSQALALLKYLSFSFSPSHSRVIPFTLVVNDVDQPLLAIGSRGMAPKPNTQKIPIINPGEFVI